MNTNPKLNASGYKDITAFKAINNVSRKTKSESGVKTEPQMVFICSPFAGDTKANTNKALQYCKFAVSKGKFPIAPHCYFPLFMNDGNSAERELGISFGLRLLYDCRELWLFGTHVSEGMKRELFAAKRRGIRIRQFNESMEEIRNGTDT